MYAVVETHENIPRNVIFTPDKAEAIRTAAEMITDAWDGHPLDRGYVESTLREYGTFHDGDWSTTVIGITRA